MSKNFTLKSSSIHKQGLPYLIWMRVGIFLEWLKIQQLSIIHSPGASGHVDVRTCLHQVLAATLTLSQPGITPTLYWWPHQFLKATGRLLSDWTPNFSTSPTFWTFHLMNIQSLCTFSRKGYWWNLNMWLILQDYYSRINNFINCGKEDSNIEEPTQLKLMCKQIRGRP